MSQKISQVRQKLQEIGDQAKVTYDNTKDLKAAQTAIKAYGEVTRTALVQVQYKKLTGNPEKIDFLQ